MKRALKFTATALVVLGVGFTGYGALGYWDAIRQSDKYETRADALIADGRGPDGLGAERLRQLVLVQDPAYLEHSGIDFSTQGAGLTTISQSLSKRLGFDEFRPGIGKIRQTGFALGLESQLSKDQILALWLDSVEMGRGPDGWMTGFFHASESIYGRPLMDISDQEYHRLLAVLIAPGQFRLLERDDALDDRSSRIARLISGDCSPEGQRDVWLDSCV
ncbi:transglycosylase domain-containing protein [Roseinatronobacter sp. S2]|uniref:transglycosylase domain-containing protein n=1 Tax=Roseinatronobacter sp. S2 TaxID=3035471 RepID=UPI002410B652|nr:transglycosylase domain-containing protein [Roseinatronobacter sp. S2]WFE76032.1 transglycosylase domain-containing protein [Roseinatronobacter sp. S2]